ncbi:hypothetical protein [Shimia sp.]|uniref:hypothetical protein n=1 Tax=Shimia sp. TaxID=1954381 RepID=UPI003564523B
MVPAQKQITRPGLARADFTRIARNGIGDAYNSYPHSMAWFRDRLIVGTTRSNLCLFKVSKIKKRMDRWPIECPDYVYDLDMRAQIWEYDPLHQEGTGENAGWRLNWRSPHIQSGDETLPRELGYRGMCVFRGASDEDDCLYVATYAPARAHGTRILRSLDGRSFEEIPMPEGFDKSIITLRLLIPFKGKLFTSPTGRAGGDPNLSGNASIYVSDDPVNGKWQIANPPAFGDPSNLGIFEMIGFGDYIYAGTATLNGFQIWRSRAEGPPPYHWERIIFDGAFRGSLNQGVASFCVHNGALYAGGGIQHGGVDMVTGTGPAGPELIRIQEDGSWDLIVGSPRYTMDGMKMPKSAFRPGFGSIFNGYFWRMASHDGWLYLGTLDWSTMLPYSEMGNWPGAMRRGLERFGLEEFMAVQSGAELFRSADGENWLPVDRRGFGNRYNYGIRTLQSTPHGLAVGFVNPFGPRIGLGSGEDFAYHDNPDGGCEIWLGSPSKPGA